jgi:hypothetical protein
MEDILIPNKSTTTVPATVPKGKKNKAATSGTGGESKRTK